jgi:hypothetical protein
VVTSTGPFAFACDVCGSVYTDRDRAGACEAFPAEPEEIAPGTLVRAREAGPATGLGWLKRSYLLGLDDPRGQAHIRLYRAAFLWGSADFRVGELEPLGPASEAEWRAAVERGEE